MLNKHKSNKVQKIIKTSHEKFMKHITFFWHHKKPTNYFNIHHLRPRVHSTEWLASQSNLSLARALAWSAVSLHPAHVRHSSQNHRPPLASRAASSAPRPPPTHERCTELPQSEHELRGSAQPSRFLAAVPRHSPQIGKGADCWKHTNWISITKHTPMYNNTG